jgi:hypothetical protein
MSPEKCASVVSGVLKGQIPQSIEFERSDEAIESLVWGFADLQHPDERTVPTDALLMRRPKRFCGSERFERDATLSCRDW